MIQRLSEIDGYTHRSIGYLPTNPRKGLYKEGKMTDPIIQEALEWLTSGAAVLAWELVIVAAMVILKSMFD